MAKFTVLKSAQRELWLTFAIKLLIICAYSITNKTLILWLSSDLGFSDQSAGALVGWVWAPAMTVFTLLAGSLTLPPPEANAVKLDTRHVVASAGRAPQGRRA